MYETGPWSIRLAYNWRSRYLLTASEANLRLPIWQDDFGQLDGSFFYNINKNIQIGPVSYTHLDVYKRQQQHRGDFGTASHHPSAAT